MTKMAKLFFVLFVTIGTIKMLINDFQDGSEVFEKDQKPRCPDSPRDGANRDILVCLFKRLFFHVFSLFLFTK
jgi:hypothetical protein